jgi:hypothetical protein
MDMQLQDKLLAYKQEMGLLPSSTTAAQPASLPAAGETSANQQGGVTLQGGIGSND